MSAKVLSRQQPTADDHQPPATSHLPSATNSHSRIHGLLDIIVKMDQAAQRGTKRKRYEPPPQDLGVKIGGKLHHDLKEVKRAAKKAKVFETQKLVKKLKDLRKNAEGSNAITEMEQQLELLKQLDHELVATTALKTKLNKLQILCKNEHVQAAISKKLITNMVPAAPGSSAAKVQSRLLSSKTLATEIAEVVNSLKNIIQPPAIAPGPVEEEDELVPEKPKKIKKDNGGKKTVPLLSGKISTSSAAETSREDELGEGAEVDDAGWESGTVDEDDAVVQDSWEPGSVSGDEEAELSEGSDWDSDEGKPAVSPPVLRKAPSKAPPTKITGKPIALQSTFLPSLSVGFTRGESDDSDLSETEVKVADLDIKKNRRGQRARRAIWEKKFGKNANHKKKEAEAIEHFGQRSERTANTRHSPTKRPTRRHSDVKSVPQYRQDADKGWAQRITTAPVSASQRSATMTRNSGHRRVEEKPIHPSWEAKRKLKEKESAGIVPSQGKKIKF